MPCDPEHDRQFPIRLMCRASEVSPGGGYYAWRARPESVREAANRALVARLMHGEGIRAKTVKKWRATTYASPATCRDGGTVGTMPVSGVFLVS